MFLNKAYLFLALLSIFVVCSVCEEEKPGKIETSTDGRKSMLDRSKEGGRRKDKYAQEEDEDDIDKRLAAVAALADNRLSPLGIPEGNYRTRGRWPGHSSSSPSSFTSPFDSLFAAGNDRSRLDLSSLFSSLPSPSTPQEKSSTLDSTPSCHSLVDSQYPIFSDICGAVPQARYSLPNTFGHRERWQVAQTLSAFISSMSDSSCTRSLRLLICPVLFPPCPSRHEPPTVLPCQSYCRAVKARCGTPALDVLRCETLPQSSDLCPTSQTYGSFAAPEALASQIKSSPLTDGYPTSNFPMSRSQSPLRSLLSGQGFQGSLPQSSLSSLVSQQPTGLANLNSVGVPTLDSFSPLLADFASRPLSHDPRQTSKFSPLARSSFDTRSAVEVRPQLDVQFSSGSRPSAKSSIIKA